MRKKHRAWLPILVGMAWGLGWLLVGDQQSEVAAGQRPASLRGQSGAAMERGVVNLTELAQHVGASPDRRDLAAPGVREAPAEWPLPSSSLPSDPLIAAPSGEALPPAPPGLSPDPADSFLALGDNNVTIPPDTHGAVGPAHLMVMLNSQVRVQQRDGAALLTVGLNEFWTVAGGSGAFDPKVLYDPYGQRWIVTACDDARSPDSALLIGVSQTSDPMGAWNLYRLDGDAGNVGWVDYPSLGFTRDWITVQVNINRIVGDTPYRTDVYAFNKADLYTGGSGLHTLFMLDVATYGRTIVPAITYDPVLATHYLLQNYNGNPGDGNGYLGLYTITGPVGSEVFTAGPLISTPNPWGLVPPSGADFAPQLDTTVKIQNNDARMQNVVYRNETLWATHTVFLPAGAVSRSAVQWWQLAPNGTVLQRARIDDPTGATFYAFPSLTVNQANDMLIGYSRFSATQYASANYAYRAGSDPLNSLRPDRVLKEGEGIYHKIGASGRNRWGDYSNTVVDPLNDLDMWTIQEYAALPVGTGNGSGRWGTWWGRIIPPPVSPTPTATATTSQTPSASPTGSATPTTTFTATVTGSATTSPTPSVTSSATATATASPTVLTTSPTPTATGIPTPPHPLYLPLIAR